LRKDDAILTVNGDPLKTFIEFTSKIIDAGQPPEQPQRPVTLLVRRGPERLELTGRCLPLSALFNAELIRRKIGVVVEDLEKERGSKRPTPIMGVLVTSVDRGGPAARELEPNAIIQAIDGQNTRDIISAARALYAKKKGETAELTLVIPRQRGNVTLGYQATAAVTVR
jgi:S1-C subfamily serine protease